MATEVGPGSATTATRPAAPAAVSWGAWAGIVYVLAWLIGLFLAPSAPVSGSGSEASRRCSPTTAGRLVMGPRTGIRA